MVDTTFLAQFLAVALFAACLLHSWNTEGRRAAQQWFLVGYMFALLLVNLLVVIEQITYNPALLVIGAAPSLLVMFFPALWYLGYTIAKFFADENDLRAMMYWMFLLTPALMLPLDAVALQLGWWAFPSESYNFLNGVPFYAPIAWGAIAAMFMYMMGRIRKIRFRGNGQFFAMVIAAPLLDALALVVIAIIQIVVNTLAVLGGVGLLYGALAVLYIALPLALAFRWQRNEH
ncbi:MAG: hypothetical protein HY741_11160 [Chloroflexi bacterium]|nr:hypothetical protein [Chloroflexota bacterium]